MQRIEVAGWRLADEGDRIVLFSPRGEWMAIPTVADLEVIAICIRKYFTP